MWILFVIFFTVFLAEIGDKTMLVILSFSTKMSLFQIISGLFIGTFLAMSIPVFFGKVIFMLIPSSYIVIISSLLFILIGLWFLYAAYTKNEVETKTNMDNLINKFPGWLATALIIIILEMGDKTELITFGFSSEKINSFLILIAASMGMILSNLSVLVIKPLIMKIEEVYLNLISGTIFLGIGVFSLLK